MCVFDFSFGSFRALFSESTNEIQGIVELEVSDAVVTNDEFSDGSFELLCVDTIGFIPDQMLDISLDRTFVSVSDALNVFLCGSKIERT